MPLSLVPTTELEAVNYIIGTIGEMPFDSLEDASVGDVVKARAMLAFKNRQLQATGWEWNREEDLELTPNESGEILLPANTLSVDASDHTKKIVERGRKLYDREAKTFVFTEPVKVDLITLLPFEEIPQTARDFITISAGRVFQAGFVGSQILDRLNEDDEQIAMIALLRDEEVSADNNMLDNPRIMRDRRR